MSISYASAYKKRDEDKEKKHALYKELNMTDEQIKAIDEFDDREFRSDCVYRFHTQPLDIPDESDFDDGQNPLYKEFGDVLSVEMKLTFSGKHGWLQDISSPDLLERLLELSEEQLDLLEAYVFDERTLLDIANELHMTKQGVHWKLGNIRKKLGRKDKKDKVKK